MSFGVQEMSYGGSVISIYSRAQIFLIFSWAAKFSLQVCSGIFSQEQRIFILFYF